MVDLGPAALPESGKAWGSVAVGSPADSGKDSVVDSGTG